MKEWHSKDLRDVENYLNQLIENKKKAMAETTTAKKKTKEGTTNTPVPIEEAKKPEADEIGKYKAHYMLVLQ